MRSASSRVNRDSSLSLWACGVKTPSIFPWESRISVRSLSCPSAEATSAAMVKVLIKVLRRSIAFQRHHREIVLESIISGEPTILLQAIQQRLPAHSSHTSSYSLPANIFPNTVRHHQNHPRTD